VIRTDWNPIGHVGPIPINWYGLGWAAAFLVGWYLVRRWASASSIKQSTVEEVIVWIMLGSMLGARLYYVAQNEPVEYLMHPWRILAFWEGGLAFFGGLFGGIGAAYLYARRAGVPFAPLSDLFAPAVPVGAAIGRIACGVDGMDYGTPTQLPWGVIYLNPNSYAPIDGVPRHPDQYYELIGDLIIATMLLRLRGKLPDGALFLAYLVLFSVLRFFLFFVRGNVPVVALGLKNGQWTAAAIVVVSLPMLLARLRRVRPVA